MIFAFHLDLSGGKYIHKLMESLLDENNNTSNIQEAFDVDKEDISF